MELDDALLTRLFSAIRTQSMARVTAATTPPLLLLWSRENDAVELVVPLDEGYTAYIR